MNSRTTPDEASATHAKMGKWTPTRDGKFEIYVVKRVRCGVLAHVRPRNVDKSSGITLELQAEAKT